MLDAFYRQLFHSVGIHKIEQDMEILHALMCKSTFALTWLSRLDKFFGYIRQFQFHHTEFAILCATCV